MKTELAFGETCRVLNDGKWALAKVLRVNKKSVMVNRGTDTVTVPFEKIWKCKKKPVIRTFRGGKADSVIMTKRIGRHRKLVEVVPTFFDPTQVMGNFQRMLADSSIRNISVCFFNDNHSQWMYAGLNPTVPQLAGGGNAIARPYEHLGDAIGIPTGPYYSLTQMIKVQFAGEDTASERSVKEIIDEAFNRAVRMQLANPHKTIFYYSADPDDPHGKRLGLGIFAHCVGLDVVDLITKKLTEFPHAIQKARVTGHIP